MVDYTKIKKAGYNVQQPYGFSTKTSPSFIEYAKMPFKDIIQNIDIKGLIIFMLDDGWISKHSKRGNFCISGGVFNKEQLECICNRFADFEIKDAHVTNIKKLQISIPSYNNELIYKYANSFIPNDIDIMIKKFTYIKDQLHIK